MKRFILFISLASIGITVFSQAAYILPSPTGKSDTITLFINIAQTTDGVQNSGLNARLNEHPEDSIYLWTWAPGDPLGVGGNGTWDNSNQALKMTKVSDKLYSLRFLPTALYAVDATTFFTAGINCLAKMKNGGEYAGIYPGEAKTEDLHVTIIPRLCDELYCNFPENAKRSDYLSITYDNNQETNPAMQNLGPDECYLFLRAEQTVFSGYNYTTAELTTSTPALKMKPVPGHPGFFRITILPEDFFEGILPETFDFLKLKYYALKPGYTYSSAPPFQTFTFKTCD